MGLRFIAGVLYFFQWLMLTGKHAANSIAQPWAGKAVSISGFAIQRGYWEELEIRNEQYISLLNNEAAVAINKHSLPTIEPLGSVELDINA